MAEIIVNIDREGNVSMETKGFKGPSCLKATEELEKVLGKKTSEKKTAEYYLQQNQTGGLNVGLK